MRRRAHGRAVLAAAAIICSLIPVAPLAADGRQALQSAAALVQQGRLDEAAAQAQAAARDPATRPAAYSVLGAIRLQQKRLADSVQLLREAIRLEPRLIGARLMLAQAYTLQGKPALAQPLYERVIVLDPMNAAARIGLAQRAAAAGQYRKALDLAAPVGAAFRQSPEGLLVLAASYLHTGDKASAGALADDWMRLPGVPPEASIKFAVLLLEGGVNREALRVLEQTNRTAVPSYELAFNLAGAYLVNGDEVRALQAYDLAASLRADALPALRQAARLAETQGNLERALSYWLRARKAAPDDPDVLFGFGRVCLKMDLLDDAEPALAKASALRPGVMAVQYTLAAAKVGKREYEAARTILEPLVAGHPGDAQLQYALGAVLYTEGRLPDAEAHLRASVRLQPSQLASRYYLALIARDQGRDGEATEALEAVLRDYPDHALSSEALGSLLMSARRYDEAERRLRDAVRLNPSSVKAHYQLGLLLSRMGRADEAGQQLALAKTLRVEDDKTSRLQLRLADTDQ